MLVLSVFFFLSSTVITVTFDDWRLTRVSLCCRRFLRLKENAHSPSLRHGIWNWSKCFIKDKKRICKQNNDKLQKRWRCCELKRGFSKILIRTVWFSVLVIVLLCATLSSMTNATTFSALSSAQVIRRTKKAVIVLRRQCKESVWEFILLHYEQFQNCLLKQSGAMRILYIH